MVIPRLVPPPFPASSQAPKRAAAVALLVALLLASGCSPAAPANTAPTAAITAAPAAGDTATEFLFDASASSDAEDPLTSLVVRWDWDGDGVWDASSAASSTATHVFAAAGSWTVTCEVEDTGGLTSSASTSVSVASARLRFVAMGDSRGSTEAEPVNSPVLGAIVDASVSAAWTNPVTELIVGTCGAPISLAPTEPCDACAAAYHFCVVDLDGRVAAFTVYGSAMDVIDTITLTR